MKVRLEATSRVSSLTCGPYGWNLYSVKLTGYPSRSHARNWFLFVSCVMFFVKYDPFGTANSYLEDIMFSCIINWLLLQSCGYKITLLIVQYSVRWSIYFVDTFICDFISKHFFFNKQRKREGKSPKTTTTTRTFSHYYFNSITSLLSDWTSAYFLQRRISSRNFWWANETTTTQRTTPKICHFSPCSQTPPGHILFSRRLSSQNDDDANELDHEHDEEVVGKQW